MTNGSHEERTGVLVIPRRRSLPATLFEDPASTLRRRHLTDQEQVLYEDPPAAASFVLASWWQWALVAACAWWVVEGGRAALVPAGMVACVTVAYAAWGYLQRYYTRYVITTMRVLRMRGIVTRSIDWMPLSRITDVSFKQNPFEQIFGFADVKIHSAAERTGLRTLDDVADPARFHQILTACVEAKNPNVVIDPWSLHRLSTRR